LKCCNPLSQHIFSAQELLCTLYALQNGLNVAYTNLIVILFLLLHFGFEEQHKTVMWEPVAKTVFVTSMKFYFDPIQVCNLQDICKIL